MVLQCLSRMAGCACAARAAWATLATLAARAAGSTRPASPAFPASAAWARGGPATAPVRGRRRRRRPDRVGGRCASGRDRQPRQQLDDRGRLRRRGSQGAGVVGGSPWPGGTASGRPRDGGGRAADRVVHAGPRPAGGGAAAGPEHHRNVGVSRPLGAGHRAGRRRADRGARRADAAPHARSLPCDLHGGRRQLPKQPLGKRSALGRRRRSMLSGRRGSHRSSRSPREARRGPRRGSRRRRPAREAR